MSQYRMLCCHNSQGLNRSGHAGFVSSTKGSPIDPPLQWLKLAKPAKPTAARLSEGVLAAKDPQRGLPVTREELEP